ncbi:ATP-binding protein [Streptomyces prunicolor]|uniref:ATP-binding protein n=1 Tax=Streptomyces prunicolor TaxID=67348 RepID=UPI00225BC923|nr:ATP-binding protein [Streptomyces prunicolor]MCX5237874.1 ATP-binding protein [Streptomyces prunicolor]
MNEQLHQSHTREAFYRRDRRSVALAREFTRNTLADWEIADRADEVLLCVSELATNAILHGVPPGRGLALRLCVHLDGILRVEVHDSGTGELRDVRSRYRDLHAEDGRGLMLVSMLADKWGVGERAPGKVVWCEFAVGYG